MGPLTPIIGSSQRRLVAPTNTGACPDRRLEALWAPLSGFNPRAEAFRVLAEARARSAAAETGR